MSRKSKTDHLEKLFGLVPDKQIATLAGVKQAASVQTQRQKKGMASFKTNLNKIKKALPSLNAKSNNADVAKELDVPVELLAALRVETEIIADPKAAIKKYDLHKEVVQALLDMQTHEKPGRKAKKTNTTSKKKTLKPIKVPKIAKSARKSAPKAKEEQPASKIKKEKKPVAKKEVAEKPVVKKEVAEKPVAKKEVVKKEKNSVAKKEPTQFLNAYECTFVHGDEMTLVYVTASSFQEASKKVEGIDSVKGGLNSINLLGFALS